MKKQDVLKSKKIGFFREKIIIKSIQKGFGHTIGNLLSAALFHIIPGVNITKIKKTNSICEYQNYNVKIFPGFILNFQTLSLKYVETKKSTLKFSSLFCIKIGGNHRNVYSCEIRFPNKIIILTNKKILEYREHKLFTIVGVIEKRAGYYCPGMTQLKNFYLLDRNFSPIQFFNYFVQDLSQKKTENIINIIATNGSIKPDHAIQIFSKKIQNQIRNLTSLKNKKKIIQKYKPFIILLKQNKYLKIKTQIH